MSPRLVDGSFLILKRIYELRPLDVASYVSTVACVCDAAHLTSPRALHPRHQLLKGRRINIFRELFDHRRGQARDGGRLIEPGDSELDFKRVAKTRRNLNGQQRVPAQLDEVVMDSDGINA